MAFSAATPWLDDTAQAATTAAGGAPSTSPDWFERAMNRVRGVRERIKEQVPAARASIERAPLARIAGLGTAGLVATQQLQQGNPLGAVAEGGGALAGGAVASAMFRGAMAAPGGLGMLARVGIPLAGSLLGGSVAGGITGAVKAKADEPGAAPLYIPGTNIPLNQAGQLENLRNRDLAYELRASKSRADQDLQINRQFMADARQDEQLRAQANLPILERIQRGQLVNAQAMLASQTAAYQQMGRTAGMFKLAQGAQAQTGETLRTAISQNPYLGATLSAPNISF